MSKRPITNYQLPITKRLRVCVVTGSRAEFGIWRPVLQAIQASSRLELKLVVTGMHLLKGFGETVNDIGAEGFAIAEKVLMYEEAKLESGAAASLARGIEGLAQAYRKWGADLVMVLGDRLEMLAAASAALAERIPLAHIHGGETAPGIWDEQIRHAITKMAHVHFCATKTSGARIVRMGEPKASVHVVGAPALDEAAAFFDEMQLDAKMRRMEDGISPLLVLHPSGGNDDAECARAMIVLHALKDLFPGDGRIRMVGPNNDPGCQGIIRASVACASGIGFVMSMEQEGFWWEMMTGGLLVGNSSSGIIEAATLGVPVVNIGDRQAGRERNANVIDVPWDGAAIQQALRRATSDKAFLRRVARCKNVYGDGKASARIVNVLETIARNGISLEKRFV